MPPSVTFPRRVPHVEVVVPEGKLAVKVRLVLSEVASTVPE